MGYNCVAGSYFHSFSCCCLCWLPNLQNLAKF